MKKLSLALGLLMLASFGAVEAGFRDGCDDCYRSEECDFCDFNCCDLGYSFYVDYLYWDVCRSELEVYIDSENHKKIDTDYTSGFRVAGYINYKNWDLGVRYLNFDNEFKKTVGEYSAKYDYDFSTFDIELGYSCRLDCCAIELRPFVGAKLLYVDEDLRVGDALEDVKVALDHNGYGLQIGMEMRWDLCTWNSCGCEVPLAFVSRASTGILRNTYDIKVEGDFNYKGVCHYAPFHELFLGMEMSFCDVVCDWDFDVTLGYEAQYYGWREAFSVDDIAHLGFGGLVLRVGTSF